MNRSGRRSSASSKTRWDSPTTSPTTLSTCATGLGLDSVDVVGLVMRVERHFRIRLAMEELLEVKTVGDLLDLIHSKTAGLAPV